VLTPIEGKKDLTIDIHGDLAGIMSVAAKEQNTAPLVMAFQRTLSSAETDHFNKSQIMKVSGGYFPCSLINTAVGSTIDLAP